MVAPTYPRRFARARSRLPESSDEAAPRELAEELRRLIERVDELALEALRAAVEAGASQRPQFERDLTRVRHSLERALAVLERRPKGADEQEI